MNIPRAITEAVKAITPRNDKPIAVRALEAAYNEKLRTIEAEYSASGDDEKPALGISGPGAWKFGYTQSGLTEGGTRQLMQVTWSDVCAAAERIWNNPLGEWIIKVVVAHVIGGGIHYTVKVKGKKEEPGEKKKDDPDALKAQDRLDAFWTDPANGMDQLFPQLVTFLYVYGVQIIPVFPRWKLEGKAIIGDGIVEIGALDPRSLAEVRTNPASARDVTAIEVGPVDNRKIWRVVHSARSENNRRVGLMPSEGIEPGKPEPGKDEMGVAYDGACLYWRHNNAPFEKWGYPLLLKQVDYLDQADRHFFDIVERVLALQQFIWDVTIKGASTKADLDRVAAEQGIFNGPPKARAVRFHNDSVIWTAVTPSLGMSDVTPLSRWILLYILGTAGIPLHWFGEGENTNRASAEAMGRPTRKVFESLQDELKWYVKEMLCYVIDTAVIAKKLPDLPYEVEVEMPQVAVLDTKADVEALKTLGDAMQVAVTAGIMTIEQSMDLYRKVAQQIGIEVREMTPQEKAEAKAKKAQAEKQKEIELKMLAQGGKPTFGKPPVKVAKKESTPAYWRDDAVRDTEGLEEELKELPKWMQELYAKPSIVAVHESERLDGVLKRIEEEGE